MLITYDFSIYERLIMKNNTKPNIVIFSIHKWESIIESPIIFLAKHLAKNYNIIYISSPYTVKDVVKDFGYIKQTKKLSKILPFASGVESLTLDNGEIITLINSPVVLSINFLSYGKIYKMLHFINHKMIACRLKRFLRKNKVDDFIFINSFNFLYDSLDKFLQPSLNVYHCIDALVKPVSIKHGRRQEALAMKRADAVVVTSEALLEEKKQINPACHLVQNAVEIAHISKALNCKEIHKSVAGLKKPVIGFIGNIERRMDFHLISKIAGRHPQWSFALIGPVEKKYLPNEIKFPDNVHFLGKQPYKTLPNILKGIDVALIPYKKDKVSETIYPIKLNEYLAAGKPVVCTNFSERIKNEFVEVAYFADNDEEFEERIARAMREDNENLIDQRVAKAKLNDWNQRAKDFSHILETALKDKEK